MSPNFLLYEKNSFHTWFIQRRIQTRSAHTTLKFLLIRVSISLPFGWLPLKVTVLVGGSFGKPFGLEGGALINGMSDLIKEPRQSVLTPSTT